MLPLRSRGEKPLEERAGAYDLARELAPGRQGAGDELFKAALHGEPAVAFGEARIKNDLCAVHALAAYFRAGQALHAAFDGFVVAFAGRKLAGGHGAGKVDAGARAEGFHQVMPVTGAHAEAAAAVFAGGTVHGYLSSFPGFMIP